MIFLVSMSGRGGLRDKVWVFLRGRNCDFGIYVRSDQIRSGVFFLQPKKRKKKKEEKKQKKKDINWESFFFRFSF
jgi:hypothetical protein